MILQNILIHEFCRKVVDIFNSVVITTEFSSSFQYPVLNR